MTCLGLPWVAAKDRVRAKRLYDWAWVRNRHSDARPLPEGTGTLDVETPMGNIHAHVLKGKRRRGCVVLVHPDRRYGGYWFVRTGWVEALHKRGKTVLWFDQPGYGQGVGGSPYLAENVINVARAARELDMGPVDVVGQSLGSFAAAIAAPHMPWVRRIVLESPYRSFSAWYDEQPWSLGKFAARTFGRLFPGASELDTRRALGQSSQEILVAASHADDVTSLRQSEDAMGGHPVQWVRLLHPAHLELWDEPDYRDAALAFLE